MVSTASFPPFSEIWPNVSSHTFMEYMCKWIFVAMVQISDVFWGGFFDPEMVAVLVTSVVD